jgi:hypothetical protein
MSADFIEDACDSLLKSDETRGVCIAWLKDTRTVYRCANLMTVDQVEYARNEMNEFLDKVAEQLNTDEN